MTGIRSITYICTFKLGILVLLKAFQTLAINFFQTALQMALKLLFF